MGRRPAGSRGGRRSSAASACRSRQSPSRIREHGKLRSRLTIQRPATLRGRHATDRDHGATAASQTDCGLPSSGNRVATPDAVIYPDHGRRRGYRDPNDARPQPAPRGHHEFELLLDRARGRIDAGEGAVVACRRPRGGRRPSRSMSVRCRRGSGRATSPAVRVHAHDIASLVVGDPDRCPRRTSRPAVSRPTGKKSTAAVDRIDPGQRCRRACS